MTSREVLVARSETLATLLVKGQFDEVWEEFDERMRATLPLSTLARNWTGVQSEKLGPGEVTLGKPAVTVSVPVAGSRSTVRVDISYDEADRVVGLYFRWS